MRVPGGGAIVPFSWAYRRLPFVLEGDLSVGGDLLSFNAYVYDGGKRSPMTPFIMNECVNVCL